LRDSCPYSKFGGETDPDGYNETFRATSQRTSLESTNSLEALTVSKLFLVMDAQQAWEMHQVYRDHVVNDDGPEMVVSNVVWRALPEGQKGVAKISLHSATIHSLRELGDSKGLSQTGRPATMQEISQTFGKDAGG
jgi:hypothetical protein